MRDARAGVGVLGAISGYLFRAVSSQYV